MEKEGMGRMNPLAPDVLRNRQEAEPGSDVFHGHLAFHVGLRIAQSRELEETNAGVDEGL